MRMSILVGLLSLGYLLRTESSAAVPPLLWCLVITTVIFAFVADAYDLRAQIDAHLRGTEKGRN